MSLLEAEDRAVEARHLHPFDHDCPACRDKRRWIVEAIGPFAGGVVHVRMGVDVAPLPLADLWRALGTVEIGEDDDRCAMLARLEADEDQRKRVDVNASYASHETWYQNARPAYSRRTESAGRGGVPGPRKRRDTRFQHPAGCDCRGCDPLTVGKVRGVGGKVTEPVNGTVDARVMVRDARAERRGIAGLNASRYASLGKNARKRLWARWRQAADALIADHVKRAQMRAFTVGLQGAVEAINRDARSERSQPASATSREPEERTSTKIVREIRAAWSGAWDLAVRLATRNDARNVVVRKVLTRKPIECRMCGERNVKGAVCPGCRFPPDCQVTLTVEL